MIMIMLIVITLISSNTSYMYTPMFDARLQPSAAAGRAPREKSSCPDHSRPYLYIMAYKLCQYFLSLSLYIYIYVISINMYI